MAEHAPPEPSEAEAPIWLRQAWAGAKRRDIDRLTQDEIAAEIGAHRRETPPPPNDEPLSGGIHG